jgi:hypothetical protein
MQDQQQRHSHTFNVRLKSESVGFGRLDVGKQSTQQ